MFFYLFVLGDLIDRFNLLKKSEMSLLRANKDTKSLEFLSSPFTAKERHQSMEESSLYTKSNKFESVIDDEDREEFERYQNEMKIKLNPKSLESRAAAQQFLKQKHRSTLNGALAKASAHLEALFGMANKSPKMENRQFEGGNDTFEKDKFANDEEEEENKNGGVYKTSGAFRNFKSNSIRIKAQKKNLAVLNSAYVAPTGKSTLSSFFQNSDESLRKKEEAPLDPESDKFLMVILGKYAREIGEKLRMQMNVVTVHRARNGIMAMGAAGKATELNRILPPLVETFITSFTDKMVLYFIILFVYLI